MKKNLDITKPRYNEQNNFASPLALRYVEVPLYLLRTQFLCVNRQFYVIGATQGKGSTFTAYLF